MIVNGNSDDFGQNVNIATGSLKLAVCIETHISCGVHEAFGVRAAPGAQRIIPVDVPMKGFADTLRVYKVAPPAA